MKFKNKTKKEFGFTLVELIVAVGIFGILSVFVTGAFLNIMSVQKQANSRQQIMNDFRVALDLIGKEVLAGTGFSKEFPDEDEGKNDLYFQTQVRYDMISRVIHYKVKDGRIWKAQQDTLGSCQASEGSFPEECFIPFTSKEVYVDELLFYINNFNNYKNPIITIIASGEANILGSNSSFRTSESYSPREEINPNFQPPTDTTPPEIKIKQMEGNNVEDITSTTTKKEKITLTGEVRDFGGAGVKRVRLYVYDETGEEIKIFYSKSTDQDSTGNQFIEGNDELFTWEFQDVEILTGNQWSRIKIVAIDFSDNSNSDEILVFSEASPLEPSEPVIGDITFSCSEISADVEYVKLTVESTDSDVNYYEIFKNGVKLIDVPKPENEESFSYIDEEVSKGNNYNYEVVAVNTDWWEFDLRSATSAISIDLTNENLCSFPNITVFTNNIDCSLSSGPSFDFFIKAEDWENQLFYFQILDKTTQSVVHKTETFPSWDSGLNSYSWKYQEPLDVEQDFLGEEEVDIYEYEVRICFSGGNCSENQAPTNNPLSLEIGKYTCVPPDTFFWESTGLWEDLMEYLCVINDLNNPAIQINFSVERDFPEGVRPFDTFVIYEREYSSTIPRDDFDSFTEIGSCAVENDTTAVYYCHEQEYPREVAHYEYMVRGYNTENTWFGEPSYIEIEILDCGGTAPLPATSTLACTENELDDYREAHVTVDDSVEGIWHDPATILRFYRCTGDELVDCEVDYFAEHLFQDYLDGVVAVDPGPADGITHWYALETCLWDNNSCLEPIQFTFLSIDENACLPLTPMVIETSVKHKPEPVCYPPDTSTSTVSLYAVSNITSDSVFINIYKDGENEANKVAEGLKQGEVYEESLLNGETYTYYFEACYPVATPSCGEKKSEDFTVVENFCDPTSPDFNLYVHCNDLGQIASSTITVFGSKHHDGYVLERWNPALPSFSTLTNSNEPFISGEVYDPPISISKTYTYRAYSFRETLKSDWRYKQFTLDPLIDCEPPFGLDSSEEYILVSVTGGGSTKSSSLTSILVDPTGSFSGSVSFDVSDVQINFFQQMIDEGVTSEEVDVYLSKNSFNSPYSLEEAPLLSVEIPDREYLLETEEYILGAEIIVKGKSQGFETDVKVPLFIQWESGTQN